MTQTWDKGSAGLLHWHLSLPQVFSPPPFPAPAPPTPSPVSCGRAPLLGRCAHDLKVAVWVARAELSGYRRVGAPPPPSARRTRGPRRARALLGGHPALGEAEAAGLHWLRRPVRHVCRAPSFHPVICTERGEGAGLGPDPPPPPCTQEPPAGLWVVGRMRCFSQT